MRKKQTKGLLKAEDAKRQEWKGVGAGHIQRHSCVQISLISLCYKTFFFLLLQLWGAQNRSIPIYQNIHVLNVKQ